MASEDVKPTTDTATGPFTRDMIRSQILKSHEVASRVIDFFGAKIELRQPVLGEVLAAQENPDRQAAVVDMLIRQAFVPDTDERVFEDTDADQLKKLPFGKDFTKVNEALIELSDVDFLDGANDSNGTQPNT